MDELKTITNSIMNCKREEITKQIMSLCSTISPAFYKNATVEERKAEKQSIELLTSGIDRAVLALMCRMAIKQYPLERARNSRTYFDINFLLTFYEKSFNYFWCDSVAVDTTWKYCQGEFNTYTNVLTERWKKDGKEIETKYIVPLDVIVANKKHGGYERYYSPKSMSTFFDSIEDLENLEI